MKISEQLGITFLNENILNAQRQHGTILKKVFDIIKTPFPRKHHAAMQRTFNKNGDTVFMIEIYSVGGRRMTRNKYGKIMNSLLITGGFSTLIGAFIYGTYANKILVFFGASLVFIALIIFIGIILKEIWKDAEE